MDALFQRLFGNLGFLAFIPTAFVTFVALTIVWAIFKGIVRIFGFYVVVPERRAYVYVLFGKVIGVIDEPGLHILPAKLGPAAFVVNWLGSLRVVDLRLDQHYLRNSPVNSEEGAPMGIGLWYEMFVSDPVAYLFKNSDPRGSLAANVSNASVRTLSNMPLAQMLEERHRMSQLVRNEVTSHSTDWGYRLGSIYIRKVQFRDDVMKRGIEAKVVNRLRQVTAAIRQTGTNQVNIITSTADRQAAIEFGKAAATRPQIVGATLQKISQDNDVAVAMFEALETQRLLESKAGITLVPKSSGLLPQLIASNNG
ncbi:MAG: SPFH domain-containing protein [Thermoflexales bacterium]